MALQLTNIVRDVAADLRRGRIYLPGDDLARFGVAEDDLRAGSVTPAVRALLKFECARAREYYVRAAADLPAADAYNLMAAEIMGGIYFEILQRIERAGTTCSAAAFAFRGPTAPRSPSASGHARCSGCRARRSVSAGRSSKAVSSRQ